MLKYGRQTDDPLDAGVGPRFNTRGADYTVWYRRKSKEGKKVIGGREMRDRWESGGKSRSPELPLTVRNTINSINYLRRTIINGKQ